MVAIGKTIIRILLVVEALVALCLILALFEVAPFSEMLYFLLIANAIFIVPLSIYAYKGRKR